MKKRLGEILKEIEDLEAEVANFYADCKDEKAVAFLEDAEVNLGKAYESIRSVIKL